MSHNNKIDYKKLSKLTVKLELLLSKFESLVPDTEGEDELKFGDLVWFLSQSWVNLDQFVHDHKSKGE